MLTTKQLVEVANYSFSSRLLKWREKRYVLWDTKYHTTRFARNFTKSAQTIWLLREALKKVFAYFFLKKVGAQAA